MGLENSQGKFPASGGNIPGRPVIFPGVFGGRVIADCHPVALSLSLDSRPVAASGILDLLRGTLYTVSPPPTRCTHTRTHSLGDHRTRRARQDENYILYERSEKIKPYTTGKKEILMAKPVCLLALGLT